MANALYNKFKEQLLQGGVNLSTAVVKAVIVDTAGGATNYAFSQTHEFLSDVAAGARRGTTVALTGKTFTSGTFDAADIPGAFASLTGGAVEGVIFFVDTGVETTSRLIAFFDTGGGLPFTPTGNNVDMIFNASGIFSL